MARTCRRRPTERRSQGYTLIELVIAMLLTAVMVASLFSVALTSKTGGGRNDRRIVANAAARALSVQLQSFVTGDVSGASAGTINGPGAGTGGWQWTGMTSPNGGTITDNCPGGGTACWALYPGSHTLSNYLPTWFEDAAPNGYAARAKYFVVSGATVPAISITVDWTEP